MFVNRVNIGFALLEAKLFGNLDTVENQEGKVRIGITEQRKSEKGLTFVSLSYKFPSRMNLSFTPNQHIPSQSLPRSFVWEERTRH